MVFPASLLAIFTGALLRVVVSSRVVPYVSFCMLSNFVRLQSMSYLL